MMAFAPRSADSSRFIVVTRTGYSESQKAALGRLLATMVGFALCQVYLVFLPFHLWAFALLLGLSTLAAALLRRPDAAVTAAVTTAVVKHPGWVACSGGWPKKCSGTAQVKLASRCGAPCAWP